MCKKTERIALLSLKCFGMRIAPCAPPVFLALNLSPLCCDDFWFLTLAPGSDLAALDRRDAWDLPATDPATQGDATDLAFFRARERPAVMELVV
jgi:hypothetical protein